MKGAEMFEKLKNHRPVLLACEAIGWLHMTGKAHPGFLAEHGGTGVRYEPKDWHRALAPDWSSRLGRVCAVDGALRWPTTLTDFLAKFDDRASHTDIVGLLQAGHAMASGIEKNLPAATSGYLGQDATHMWLASPFGYPVRNLLADPPPILRPGAWETLIERIGQLLDDLASLVATPTKDPGPWWDWRERAIGPNGWLREAFVSTLAETRLPNNDVTLWDQSYVAAALFKAALAGAALLGSSFNWQDLKQQTRWRVLTIGLGARHYEARAVRIGDWTGARRDIDKFFQDVRKLLEVDLAVGSLVYRDDEILAFTFPGLRTDASASYAKGSLDDAAAIVLRDEIEKAIDELARREDLEDLETPPLCRLSPSTRSFIGLVKEMREARAELAIPLHRRWSIPSGSDKDEGASGRARHVCPVCQVRFNRPGKEDRTENAKKQRVCTVCSRRRKGRLEAWFNDDGDTIWISEVADKNDRVALLTLSFDLDPWLEGDRVDSLRAQSIAEWRRVNPVLEEYWQRESQKRQRSANPILATEPLASLVREIAEQLRNTESVSWKLDGSSLLLANLQEGYRHEANRKTTWQRYFERIVEDRAPTEDVHWDNSNIERNARWLVHQLFRKLPSPGRIHRFWRTSEVFFDELFDSFRDLCAAHPNRWRTRRLILVPDDQSKNGGWQDRETYLGRWRDAPFEVVYLEDQQAFVTICNLARCFEPQDSAEVLVRASQEEPLELKGDDDYQRKLAFKSVSTAERIGVYPPVIPLDRGPERFRVLVPLDRATACVEAAIAKWQKEFGRVWDRMPLRVGIVAFPRLTPFQAVIEAARNIEEALVKGGRETWGVIEVRTREGVTALSLARESGGRELVLLPTTLPDGRDDVFYPYVRVDDRNVRHPCDFQRPKPAQVYRHVHDLRPGDGVVVNPSRVASVFLDTTARRFKAVPVRPLSDFERMRETWALLRRTAPSLAALRAAWSELAERATAWRDADGHWLPGGADEWAKLARAVFAERLKASGAALDMLVDAARSGIVEWAVEWHLTLLKERLEA